MRQEDYYVIGIDFGTTYSGVAWCWSGQPDNVQVVTRWKTRLSFTSDNAKTPTEIYYDRLSGTTSWGYCIPPGVEPIRWFKLLLVDNEDLSEELRGSMQIRRARELLKELGKTATDVVADYLRLLWKHTTEDIVRERGSSAFGGSPLKIWITVPAIWEESARKRMREAVQKAGLLEYRPAGKTTLDLVAEPEAAAVAALDDFQGRKDINEDDRFVVCDAGGGTVDIISYTILKTEPVSVRECVEGQGKMCGAIFVDEAFEAMLKTTLGDKWKKLSDENKKVMINKEWEFGIKRLFDDAQKEWSVQIPVEALSTSRFKRNKFDEKGEVPMKGGQLKFRRDHIRAFFGTVFPQIEGLVRNQVNQIRTKYKKKPKAILLVGGLGSCNYLYQQLRKVFEREGIAVLQPNGNRPWTAICRGAVMSGLGDTADSKRALIVSRISRLNYGIRSNPIYEEGVHDPIDKYWDSEEHTWRARDQMDWYLKRGDDVYTRDAIGLNYYNLYKIHPKTKFVSIYHNNESEGPLRKTAAVKLLRDIRCQVKLPFDEFREYINPDGIVYRKMHYRVEMMSTGVTMKWKVLLNGEEMGSEDVEILNE